MSEAFRYETAGFGGGCHWCTEGVFDAVRGVARVEQGFIAGPSPDEAFSEAVRVSFDPRAAALEELIAIHLATHSSQSNHALRERYRSAVYVLDSAQAARGDPRGLAACLIWGPYTEREPLNNVLAELEPFLRNHEVRQTEVNAAPDYLVFIGAGGSRNRARQILNELKSQDIDSALIRLDESDNAISVGVFSQASRAERQRRRVADLGYDAAVRELARTHEVFQLVGWPRAGSAELPRRPDGYWDNIAQGSGLL